MENGDASGGTRKPRRSGQVIGRASGQFGDVAPASPSLRRRECCEPFSRRFRQFAQVTKCAVSQQEPAANWWCTAGRRGNSRRGSGSSTNIATRKVGCNRRRGKRRNQGIR